VVETTTECDYRYLADFLCRGQADALLAALASEIAWQGEAIRMFGRAISVPRLVSWCGDAGINYRYSGVDHRCHGWLPAIEPVRGRLADEFGFASQFVLLNRYRDGRDGMGWHTDDEPGQGVWIGSVSLGAPRRFQLRLRAGEPAAALELTHGSLLFMKGSIPHALPKTRRPTGDRINLTFRQCATPEGHD